MTLQKLSPVLSLEKTTDSNVWELDPERISYLYARK